MSRNIRIKKLEQRNLEIIPLLVDMTNGKFFKDPTKPKMSEKISLIAQFEKISFGEISRWTFNSIDEVFSKILAIINDYTFTEPKRTIEVEGVYYDLITEPRKESAGWWNHFESITAHISPESFLGLAYMERGHIYAETDSRGNVTNPSDIRGEAIGGQFNAKMFMDLMGFFLSKFEAASILTLIHQNPKAKMLIRKGLNPTSGKPF